MGTHIALQALNKIVDTVTDAIQKIVNTADHENDGGGSLNLTSYGQNLLNMFNNLNVIQSRMQAIGINPVNFANKCSNSLNLKLGVEQIMNLANKQTQAQGQSMSMGIKR